MEHALGYIPMDRRHAMARGSELRPLARGAVAVFGVSPRHFFAVVPKGWSRIYRGAGTVTVRA